MLGENDSWQDLMGEVSARVAARRAALMALAAAIAVLLAFGGLSRTGALASICGLALWAVVWPRNLSAETRSTLSPGGAPVPGRQSGRDRDAAIWRQMIDAFADPVLVLDNTQCVMAANTVARTTLQAPDGRHISQIYRDPELLSAVDRALGSGEAQSFEVRMVLPVERHLSGTAMPLALDAHDPMAPALLIVMHDRTEIEQLAEMRADFVANASHELRTPLASLKGFIETLKTSAKDDEVARTQFLEIMEVQAERMSRLINDLLSLSRIEMRQHVAPTARVNLVGVIEGVVQALSKIAADAGIALECDALPAEAIVIGDRDELVQVIQNLVHNGIKYGRNGGYVRISLATIGNRFSVVVADEGIGIAPQHLPRLTERFYRVSAKESRERGGTGLGLAIVKHIANRHGGEIRIESKLGKGSTFSLLLPRG